MNVHKNARLTPKGRELLIERLERGEPPSDVASTMGVSASTVHKWWRRYRTEGPAGLQDRSSRPTASHRKTPADVSAKALALRKPPRVYPRVAPPARRSRPPTRRAAPNRRDAPPSALLLLASLASSRLIPAPRRRPQRSA